MPYWLIAVREPGSGHDRCSAGDGNCMKHLHVSFFSRPPRRATNKYIFNYINKVIKKYLFYRFNYYQSSVGRVF